MRRSKIIFNEAVALSVKMPSAIYVDPFTHRETLVQPEGTPLRESHRYYGSHMKGHLHCADCTAPVFLDGMEHAGRKGSTFESRTPHFRPYPGRGHDADCDYYKTTKPSVRKNTDKAKGFLIHLDTGDYSANFSRKNGVFDEQGRVIDKDLKDRETITIRTAAGFEKFMRKHDSARVALSEIVVNNEKYEWKDFLVRYNHGRGSEARFINLAEKLMKMGKDGQIPCLMEVQTKYARTVRDMDQNRTITSKRVPYRLNDNGQKEDIVPSVFVAYDADGVMTIGPNTFVLGMARLGKHTKGEGKDAVTTYYINMTVQFPEQLAKINIENLAAKARARFQSSANSGQKPDLSPA